tara:strand:- start:7567 stop:10278 length:2712 start_codon:yes stop_codon:yes gene_type:complete
MKRFIYLFGVNLIFLVSSAQTSQFIISTNTTDNANEYLWQILDSDSVTVLNASPAFSDSSTYIDTIVLNDCGNFYFNTFSNDTANSTWSDGSSVFVIDLESSDTLIQTVGTSPPFINAVFSAKCNLMINEIHYDNAGVDTLEGVEIVGKAGYDLSCFSIYLYNGSDSLLYNTVSLSGIIPNDSCGYGAIWFPISGIQNGDASNGDGIALANSCTNYKVQFLSYEGSFVANNGLFASDTAVDIGVSESSGTSVNSSIQLVGFGEDYSSFNWLASLPNTRDLINAGQSFCPPDVELVAVSLDSVCDALSPVNARLTLTNNGSVPFSNFMVSYSVNGGSSIDEIVMDTLMPLDTIHYIFTATEDFTTASGDYNISSWCSLNRDSNASNDSLDIVLNFIDIQISDTSVCVGDSILIAPTLTNATNYVWSNGDSTSSIVYNASNDTSFTIIASNLCFSDTAIVNVYVSNPTLDLGPDLALCGSDTISLDATSSFSSFVWSSGDSVQVSYITQGGTYSVLISDSLGCSTSDTITIVHSIPQADLGSDLNICGFDSLVLNVSAFDSYLWSNGDTMQSTAVTQIGQYNVTVTDSLGCTDADTLEVFKLATPIDLGSDTIALCGASDTITLNASSNYSSYLWSTSDTLQSIAVYQTGTYSVTVYDSSACTSSDTIQLVQSNPSLDLGNDTTICNYSTLMLSAQANFNTYLWSNSDTTQNINVNQEDTYYVTVTNSFGCQASDTITISFDGPTLALGYEVIVCEGDYHTFFVSDIYSSYQWSQGGTLNYISVNQVGDYWLKVTGSDGCTTIDTVTLKNKDCSSIDEELLMKDIQIYPNPSDGLFSVSMTNLESQEQFSIELINSLGKVVETQNVQSMGSELSHSFDMRHLPNGLYHIHFNSNIRRAYKRVILQ